MSVRILASLVALASRAAALDGQATDVFIAGRISTLEGVPLVGATITIRNQSNGFTASARTTTAGQFAFVQLPLGGPYAVTARAIGFRPETRVGHELTLGARVLVEFRLSKQATELAPVNVTGEAEARGRSPGGSTRISAREVATIPALGRNFADLASLTPMAGAELSFGGQRPTSTDIRIDGMQARNMLRGGELGRGPYTISMEAIRELEVVTNLYDVTQGRQGGGALNAVTRSGDNDVAGSFFMCHRDDALSAPHDYLGRDRHARRLALYQWGGTVGGPIVPDRVHYFVAFDRQDSSEPLSIADMRTPDDEIEAQLAADSLRRFLGILVQHYGLPGDARQVGVFRRRPAAATLFARLDWQLSPAHRLTIRNNYSGSSGPNSGVGDQLIALLESRSSSRSHDNQTLLSLRSALGGAAQNELKLGLAAADRELLPNSYIPRGFVRVRSRLPDGTTGDVRLQFGGNRLAPEASGERQLQLVNTTYWQRGHHLITVGTDNALSYLKTYIPTDEYGLFEFDSLLALEARRPSRYSRQVPLGEQPRSRQYVLDAAAFAQTEWRPTPRLGATLGLRYDVTSFLTGAARAPIVEQVLGLRTDRTPTDWTNLQPRAHVMWDVRGDGRDVIAAGVGAFAAQPPYYLQANNIFFNGTQLADLTITGAAVPFPDYQGYRSDLSRVPGVPAGTSAPAYVNLISRDFETPTVWKGSVSYQRRVTRVLTLGGSLLYARTTNNYQYVDRNLRDMPAFRLDNEANRAVFVPAATVPASGRTTARDAFKHAQFTHVLELVLSGSSTQRTASVAGSLTLAGGAGVRASNSYNTTLDNTTYNCSSARTASLFTPVSSDPRDLSGSRGPSDFDFRHKVAVHGELPSWAGFRWSGRYVGGTGRPFSLVVNGDINGDDYSGNDLAFVFDPDDPATDPQVAAGLRRVLANRRSLARRCIRESVGRMSRRNCGAAPWAGRVDVRGTKSLRTFRAQSVELIIDVYNFANLLNLRWGGQQLLPQGISASNPISQQLSLLNVVGFDQATRHYRYTVNENVGVLRKRGDPYQIQIGARYSF